MTENDRQANVEIWEASKKINLEEAKRLRRENNEFRQKLAVLQRV